MTYAPKDDGDDGDDADEPLDAGELVLEWPDGYDGGVAARLERYEEEAPDAEDGDDADGKRNEEPDAP